MLPDASKFVVYFVEVLTKFENLEKFSLEIHVVLADAYIPETCCMTNEQEKVICFVVNVDNVTMLGRERDVEANDSLQRQLTPSCNLQKVVV